MLDLLITVVYNAGNCFKEQEMEPVGNILLGLITCAIWHVLEKSFSYSAEIPPKKKIY